MVAPLAVLGIITGLGTVIRAAVAPKKRYWVIWINRQTKGMMGHRFDDQIAAEGFQLALSQKGRSSAIVVRYGETWDLTHPVQRVVHQGKGKKPIKLAPTIPALQGRDFDTLETRWDTNSAVNRFAPTADWAKRANQGPYPEVSMKKDKPVRVKDFRDTTSSHEWNSDVKTRELPARFQTPDRFPGEDADIL